MCTSYGSYWFKVKQMNFHNSKFAFFFLHCRERGMTLQKELPAHRPVVRPLQYPSIILTTKLGHWKFGTAEAKIQRAFTVLLLGFLQYARMCTHAHTHMHARTLPYLVSEGKLAGSKTDLAAAHQEGAPNPKD